MFAIAVTKKAPAFGGMRKLFAQIRGYSITEQSTAHTRLIACELYRHKNNRQDIRACTRLLSRLKAKGYNKCVFERDFEHLALAEEMGINKITAHDIYLRFLPQIINTVCDNLSGIRLCIICREPKKLSFLNELSHGISEIYIISQGSFTFEDERIQAFTCAHDCPDADIVAILDGDELLRGVAVREHGLVLNFAGEKLPSTLAKTRTVADNIAFRFGKELIVKLPSGNFNQAEIAEAFFSHNDSCDIRASGLWCAGRYIGFRTVIRQLSSKAQ